MANNKVVYYGSTLIDLTGDTVTAGDVRVGLTFHTAAGEMATGTMEPDGATWTITGVVGATVTVTGNGKTYTKTIPSSGTVEFKGLTAGTWTAEMSKPGETTATITRDISTNYNDTMSFFSSIIAVTYPAGSTCTCINGSTTLTAPDTSGSYTFTVQNAGTWTVSCTDGEQVASQDVSITTDGQSESLTLHYGLMLYESGNEYTENTGGWESKRYCSLTNTPTALHAIPTAQYSANAGVFATKQKIKLTDYSTLHYHAKNNCAENGYLQVAVWATIPASGEPIAASAAHVAFSANQEKTGDLDISKLTGEYYVGGVVLRGDKVTGDGYVYSLRLKR